MNDPKYCPVPGCKEDLIDRIGKVASTLHTKINNIAKTKISKGATYGVAVISVTILLGASTIMYASYASARDKRMEQIKGNSEAINTVKEQQIEIKTKLNVELYHIKEALKSNKELSEKVLKAIEKRNTCGQSRNPND
jgi:hypothetical protein